MRYLTLSLLLLTSANCYANIDNLYDMVDYMGNAYNFFKDSDNGGTAGFNKKFGAHCAANAIRTDDNNVSLTNMAQCDKYKLYLTFDKKEKQLSKISIVDNFASAEFSSSTFNFSYYDKNGSNMEIHEYKFNGDYNEPSSVLVKKLINSGEGLQGFIYSVKKDSSDVRGQTIQKQVIYPKQGYKVQIVKGNMSLLSRDSYSSWDKIPKTSFTCISINNSEVAGKCTLSGDYFGITKATSTYNNQAQYQLFRKKLTPGVTSNCGTIIDVKNSVVQVQTGSDAGVVWVPIKSIYPQVSHDGKIIDCHDDNRYYKKYGNWVQNGGRQFYNNGTSYVDY